MGCAPTRRHFAAAAAAARAAAMTLLGAIAAPPATTPAPRGRSSGGGGRRAVRDARTVGGTAPVPGRLPPGCLTPPAAGGGGGGGSPSSLLGLAFRHRRVLLLRRARTSEGRRARGRRLLPAHTVPSMFACVIANANLLKLGRRVPRRLKHTRDTQETRHTAHSTQHTTHHCEMPRAAEW
jgi:hypothetical protein